MRADGDARSLVLQACVWQTGAITEGETAVVAVGRAEKLQRVGGEARAAVQAAMSEPRVPAALRQILAVHDHRAEAGMAGDGVVGVLRAVGLAVHQETAFAEADILDEHNVAGHRRARTAVHR